MKTTINTMTAKNTISKAILVIITLVLALATTTSQACTTLDLTTKGSSGLVNGALFQQYAPPASGSCTVTPFVRIQNCGIESGYNTNGTLQYNTLAGSFTHAIKVGDAALVNIGGVSYRQFMLDVNQLTCPPGNYLSLDGLQVFTNSVGNASGFPSLGTSVYNLDAGVDNMIKLDNNLNGANSPGDMLFYLPASLVADASKYLYLYSQFGVNNPANDGYEEWATIQCNNPIVPEPMTWVLMILGLGFAVILKTYRPTVEQV